MSERFTLVPRYRLDDDNSWLVGIDPLRRYWLSVNGDEAMTIKLDGLSVDEFDRFRDSIRSFRAMQAGDTVTLPTALGQALTITAISRHCFLIEGEVNGAPTCHLFDRESIESLLMTAHPDWICAPHHRDLGRQVLSLSWEQPAAAKVA